MVAYKIDVPPPGDFIREELEERGWSQRDLASVLGVPEQSVNAIVAGKRTVTADMAKKLGEAMDVSPEFFLNLQRTYDLHMAPEPDPGVAKKAKFYAHYPIREMARRGWIATADNADILERELRLFFRVEQTEDIPYVAHAARKTKYGQVPPAQLAWLFRVQQIAREMVVPKYSRQGACDAIDQLSKLRSALEEARHVPRILSEAGIRYVLAESLPSAKIDGVCCWLDAASPVIGMSLRYDRIDNFWFVLRHELEHVMRGHGQDAAMIDSDVETANNQALPKEEVDANEAASAFCVPKREMDSFIARKQPFFSERDILGFAGRLGVHPGLVAGQLRYRLGLWDRFSKHLTKVRAVVAPSAVVDGWGDVAPLMRRGAARP